MANFLTREKPSESLLFFLRRKDLGRIVEPSEADLYVFSILSYLRFEKMAKAKVKLCHQIRVNLVWDAQVKENRECPRVKANLVLVEKPKIIIIHMYRG